VHRHRIWRGLAHACELLVIGSRCESIVQVGKRFDLAQAAASRMEFARKVLPRQTW
jgi:hypothetical protein